MSAGHDGKRGLPRQKRAHGGSGCTQRPLAAASRPRNLKGRAHEHGSQKQRAAEPKGRIRALASRTTTTATLHGDRGVAGWDMTLDVQLSRRTARVDRKHSRCVTPTGIDSALCAEGGGGHVDRPRADRRWLCSLSTRGTAMLSAYLRTAPHPVQENDQWCATGRMAEARRHFALRSRPLGAFPSQVLNSKSACLHTGLALWCYMCVVLCARVARRIDESKDVFQS